MRKRLLWGVAALACVAVVSAAVVMLLKPLPSPGVTPENFKRLRVGMTEREAVAILGRPADSCFVSRNGTWYWGWSGDECSVSLVAAAWGVGASDTPEERFLEGGTLTLNDGSSISLPEKSGKSPLDKLREWVGLK
jgi:hypothetical protein